MASKISDSADDDIAIISSGQIPVVQQHPFLPLTLLSLFFCGAAPALAETSESTLSPASDLQPEAAPQPLTIDQPGTVPSTDDPGERPQPWSTAAPDQSLVSGTYLTAATALASPPSGSPTAVDAAPGVDEALAQATPSDNLVSQEPELDPELGVIQVRSLVEDADLGILRIREQPELPTLAGPPPPKIGFLTARVAIANSDNILLAVNDGGGLTGDTFVRPSLEFAVYPALGPQTVLIGTADFGLQRYSSQSNLNYDDLRFRLGLRQGLTPRSYGQLTFTYQELFRPGGNRSRFFKNTALGLTLARRDPITPRLALDSFYRLQFNGAQSRTETFSGPVDRDFSRLIQSAGSYLGYDITPRLQTGISYQLNLIDYTTQDRYDTFQQVIGQVAYRISPTLRLSLYGGFSFGRSSLPTVRFDDRFVGATINATIPLF